MRNHWWIGMALLALGTGCGSSEVGLDSAPMVVDRARLGDELLFVDASRAEINALDVGISNPTPTVQRISVRANPRFVLERRNWASHLSASLAGAGGGGTGQVPDPLGVEVPEGRGESPDEVLVLSDGSRDPGGDYREPPTLTAINRKHEVRHYELSEPFALMRLSGDGKFAILWGRPATADEDSLLRNPNRVALVNLDEAPSATNPLERTLKATGGDIANVLLTPPLNIAGVERPLALFTFGDGLGVWDVTNPAHEDITAEGLSATPLRLRRVVADTAEPKLYLAQEGLSALRVLSFSPAEEQAASNDFVMSLNSLLLQQNGASDMVPYLDSGKSKVLLTTGAKLSVVDANDNSVVSVALASPGERLHRFEGRAPDDPATKSRILVWGSAQSTVSFVELDNLEEAGSKNVEELSLGFPIADLTPLPGNRMLANLASNGVGILELESRRFKRVASALPIASPLVESDAERIWVGARDRLAYFEPAELASGALRLDDPIQEMFLFEAGDQCRIVVTHENPIGHVTIVDGTKATRSSSRALAGFLVDGLVK